MNFLRRLCACRRGSAAIEFAIVGVLFFGFSFTILEAAMVMDTQIALQTAVTEAARCGAIGGSQCATGVPAYVVARAESWLLADAIGTRDVTTSTTSGCHGAAGTALVVSVKHILWPLMSTSSPFGGVTLAAQSCYPLTS